MNLIYRLFRVDSKINILKRYRADSNRCTRFCRPLPSLSATIPYFEFANVHVNFQLTHNHIKKFFLEEIYKKILFNNRFAKIIAKKEKLYLLLCSNCQ